MPPTAGRADPPDARRRHPEPRAGSVRRGQRRGGDDGLPYTAMCFACCRRPALTPTGSSRADRLPSTRPWRNMTASPCSTRRSLRPIRPGSTFKTMVALAALKQGSTPPAPTPATGHGPGAGGSGIATRRTARWTCTTPSPRRATSTSTRCALKIGGPDRIAATARQFGLGQLFDIGAPAQKPGLVPDTAYKRRALSARSGLASRRDAKHGHRPGLSSSVNAAAAVRDGCAPRQRAKALNPRLVHSIGGVVQPAGAAAPDLPFAKAHLEFVRDAMAAVATSGGTADGPADSVSGRSRWRERPAPPSRTTMPAAAAASTGPRAPGRRATTPGSSPSRPTTIRATP